MLDTALWQHTKTSTTLKSPEGLKDSECKKGQLSRRPPILYVPPIDLGTTKEAQESLKIKFPMGPSSTCPSSPKGTLRNTLPLLSWPYVS